MSSYISFREQGVWMRESAVSLIAALLSDSLLRGDASEWSSRSAAKLNEIASTIFQGYMSLKLDELIQTDEQRLCLVGATHAVIRELAESNCLSVQRQYNLARPPSTEWRITGPLETGELLRYATILLLILEGAWPHDETFNVA